MRLKIDVKQIDVKKILPLLGGALTLAGVVVSNKIDANNRNDMKAEIKDEVLKELLPKKD